MYSDTIRGHREHVQQSKDVRVLQAVSLNNITCRLLQTTTTTTEHWVGLSYDDAASLLSAAGMSSELNGSVRNYLGDARITVSSGGVSMWFTSNGCWGNEVNVRLTRMNDTNCYSVVKTTTSLSVTNNGGSLQLL